MQPVGINTCARSATSSKGSPGVASIAMSSGKKRTRTGFGAVTILLPHVGRFDLGDRG